MTLLQQPHDHLAIYLRNHEAAGRAGRDLFRRAASSQRRRPWGDVLAEIRDEVREDLVSLRAVLRAQEVPPDPFLGVALQIGERVGRLKPNGSLVRRSALSDLIEVEGLIVAVRAKANGWRSLLAADLDARAGMPDLAALLARAELQATRLEEVHRRVAVQVLRRSGDHTVAGGADPSTT